LEEAKMCVSKDRQPKPTQKQIDGFDSVLEINEDGEMEEDDEQEEKEKHEKENEPKNPGKISQKKSSASESGPVPSSIKNPRKVSKKKDEPVIDDYYLKILEANRNVSPKKFFYKYFKII
jgi:hypothetical protein